MSDKQNKILGLSQLEREKNRNIVDAVNKWISEYRENSLAEKSLSVEKLTEWKIEPSPPEIE